MRRKKQKFQSEYPCTKFGSVGRGCTIYTALILYLIPNSLPFSFTRAPNLANFYFLCIWKSRVSLFSLYLRSTSSSRILFRRSLFLYAHLFFLSPNVYISLQIFMRILFQKLILFFGISSLALNWSFVHFMYIRIIYIFYLQLN